MVLLKIDDSEVQTPEGATLLETADAAGIYIPRLCSHPDLPVVNPQELEPWKEVFRGGVSTETSPGADRWQGCQLCLVAVGGRDRPVRACATPAEPGMRVTTSTAEIDSQRRAKLGRIFSTHPHACVQCAQKAGCALEPCSTNVAKEERCCPIFHRCELRKLAEFVGIPEDTPRYRPSGLPVAEDEPLFLIDPNLCIGCLRCVRICADVRKVGALGFILDREVKPLVGTRAPTLTESGCRFCLSCVEVCPTGSLRLKLEEARLNGKRLAPCVAACPAGMDVPRYLREIRRGEFARAEAVIREAAPLPRVLGQVCFHPCEDHCLRGELSEPMAICGLKRAAAEHTDRMLWKEHLETLPATGRRVAVLGAGPAGLTAAWFLRLKGHGVALLDSQPSPGGWLRDGIPRYRLTADALEEDIQEILNLGIDLQLGTQVGRDVDFGELRRSHDAVLIAAGARRARRLSCYGAELPGVESGLELLQRLAATGNGQKPTFAGETVMVIGGGNVAMDVARTALRLAPKEVHLYCLEKRDAMPAHGWEIAAAEEEGVIVHAGWGPVRIGGRQEVDEIVFRRCVSVFDEKGRFAPRFDEETTLLEEADRILIAIGQEPALDLLEGSAPFELTEAGYLETDAKSMQTSVEGVFAAGEVVSGPTSVIEAIAHARRAATGIDRYLGGDGNIYFPLLDRTEPDAELGSGEGFADLHRTPVSRLPAGEVSGSFALLEGDYSPHAARREADRCLRCDLRLDLRPVPAPPGPWLALTPENIGRVPSSEGVYQLLDSDRLVYAIKGARDLKEALSEILATSEKARFFLFDEDPLYSKRESELIQAYLQEHGRMPPGEGEDDLDDLF
jgi:NADPH-dependent glutamate synthase beta subunit-like oxidoreductase